MSNIRAINPFIDTKKLDKSTTETSPDKEKPSELTNFDISKSLLAYNNVNRKPDKSQNIVKQIKNLSKGESTKDIIQQLNDTETFKKTMNCLNDLNYKKAKEIRKNNPTSQESLQRLKDIENQKAAINFYLKKISNDENVKPETSLPSHVSFRGKDFFKSELFGKPWYNESAFDNSINDKLKDKPTKDRYISFLAEKSDKSINDIKKEISPEKIGIPPLKDLIENQASILHNKAIQKNETKLTDLDFQSESEYKQTMASIKEKIGQAVADSLQVKSQHTSSVNSEVFLSKEEEEEINKKVNKDLKILTGSDNAQQTERIEYRKPGKFFKAIMNGERPKFGEKSKQNNSSQIQRIKEDLQVALSEAYTEKSRLKKFETDKKSENSSEMIEFIQKPVNFDAGAGLSAKLEVNEMKRDLEADEINKEFQRDIENANIVFSLKNLLMQKKTNGAEILAVGENNQNYFEANENKRKGDEYYAKGNYSMAASNYTEAIENRQSFLKTYEQKEVEDSLLGDLLFKAGESLKRNNEPEKADKYFSDALQTKETIDSPDKTQACLKLGQVKCESGYKEKNKGKSDELFRSSIYYLKKVLEADKVITEEKDQAIGSLDKSYSGLGSKKEFNLYAGEHYLKEGQPYKSCEYYKSALKEVEQSQEKDPQEETKINKLLGEAFYDGGNYLKSAEYKEKGINILESTGVSPEPKESYDLAQTWIKAADILVEEEKFAEAASAFEKVVNNDKNKSFGFYPIIVSRCAEEFYNSEDYEKSVKYHEQYLSMHREKHGEHNQEYIDALSKLGYSSQKLESKEQAVDYYSKALGISNILYGKDSRESTRLNNNIKSL
ncbi:MAG: tetratricopeptide repeat protein [Firmicutes bacterium]|nr:tetratricopeptide repeat protein [Bacillota bacterium]